MQALLSSEGIALELGLCVYCDASRAVGLAHVQLHISPLVVAGFTVLVILKVKVALALVGRDAGDQGRPLPLNVWVVTLEKDWVQIPVCDQTVFNDFTLCEVKNKINYYLGL